MKRFSRIALLAIAVVAIVAAGTATADEPGVKNRRMTMNGEIVAVRQQTQLQNQGEVFEIKIRTQNREEHWLQLGPGETFGDAVQQGDRVRVRLMRQGAGEPAQVQTMLNYRSGERIRVCDGTGAMIQQRDRLRDGSGTGLQWRHRQAGSQNGSGNGNNGGGSGSNGGGHGNNGGGGGRHGGR